MSILTDSQVFKFRFNELGVTPGEIQTLLGFGDEQAHEPFPQYIREVLAIAEDLKSISGSYIFFDSISFDLEHNTITINDTVFNTGKIITRQLRKAATAALFVCTAGTELELFAKEQMKIGNIPEAYIADLAGSVIVEAALDKMQASLAADLEKGGLCITNRYSPGYCGWNVKEQQHLFELLPKGICNITLAESSMMYPIKSVSGIIGIGSGIKKQPYSCKICDMDECIYRNRIHH